LPVAVYFLSKIGILTPVAMRKNRRYALVIIMFLGAMFTPPDPLSMVLVAVPLFGLYQLSILISSAVARKREKELEEALS
ncbi:MAG: twin-arginine translocase subunit TatC, partial [Rhodothermales bacterium]|nr:twin-arginine translocase subunit TatC [Rhodothermales bacterium]